VLVLARRAEDDPGVYLTLAGERYDADRLVEFAGNTEVLIRKGAVEPDSYLIEERLQPHPALAELVGPALCCMRVVTFIGLGGSPEILGTVYKMQPKPLGVDHLSYGAIGSWVDLESGALGPGRSRHEFGYTTVIPGTDRGRRKRRVVHFTPPDPSSAWPDDRRLQVALRHPGRRADDSPVAAPTGHYHLRCPVCAAEFEDDGIVLRCPEPHEPALLLAEYEEPMFRPDPDVDGIFKYRDWLPASRVLPKAGGTVVYHSKALNRMAGLSNLWRRSMATGRSGAPRWRRPLSRSWRPGRCSAVCRREPTR
jgi:hypothetical protein